MNDQCLQTDEILFLSGLKILKILKVQASVLRKNVCITKTVITFRSIRLK